MQPIIEQLKAARVAKKITQSVVAERLGMTQGHISAIESEKVDPRLSSVVEIARVLDHEPMLIPRTLLPMIRALLSGKPNTPLWEIDSSDDESTESGEGL